MNERAIRVAAFCCGLLLLLAPRVARAGEFCPARIAAVTGVAGAPASYAVRLAASSPRAVTGAFLLETAGGWYRAAFEPVAVQGSAHATESAPIFVDLPKPAPLLNVWLAQAASDDPQWGTRGVVSCAPDPERHTARGVTQKPPAARAVSAAAIAPPLTYGCKTPFADARVTSDSMYVPSLGPGQYVAVEVDLDANGNPIGATALDASQDDFTLKKRFENHVKYMHFTPAIAYCRPVPSIYILKSAAP